MTRASSSSTTTSSTRSAWPIGPATRRLEPVLQDVGDQAAGRPGLEHDVDPGAPGGERRQDRGQPQRRGGLERADPERPARAPSPATTRRASSRSTRSLTA